MADNNTVPADPGETFFGSTAVPASGLGVKGGNVHDSPSYWTLNSTTAGGVTTTYYVWADSSGVLRRGSTKPGSVGFNQDSTGTAV